MKDWGNRIEVKDSDELLEGIEAIGISDKDNDRLKKKVLMRAGLEQHSTVRNRRHARRTVLLVAAILMCTIGVFAATQFGALELFWGEDPQGYNEIAKETNQSVETKDIRLNIEGVAADKYQCVFILTAEALTSKGEKILEDITPDHENYKTWIRFEEPREDRDDDGDENGIAVMLYDDVNARDNYKAYQCYFPIEAKDYSQPVKISFAGLSMAFDLPKLEAVTRFYPERENQSIPYVEGSSLGYYYMAKELADISLIKADGTLEEEIGYKGGMYIGNNQTGPSLVTGWFTKLVNVKEYKGFQINGVKYINKNPN